MLRHRRAAAGSVQVAGVVLLACVAGCGSSEPLREAGLALSPPEGWRRVEATAWPMPGTPLAAWKGPEGSSLVAYRTLPSPGATAESVGAELANRLVNLPGVRDLARSTPSIAGQTAARIEAVAPGTGDALAPSGTGQAIPPAGKALVDTRRVGVGFPGPAGTLWLAWHFPEAARDRLAPQVEATLKTVRLESRRLASSSY